MVVLTAEVADSPVGAGGSPTLPFLFLIALFFYFGSVFASVLNWSFEVE